MWKIITYINHLIAFNTHKFTHKCGMFYLLWVSVVRFTIKYILISKKISVSPFDYVTICVFYNAHLVKVNRHAWIYRNIIFSIVKHSTKSTKRWYLPYLYSVSMTSNNDEKGQKSRTLEIKWKITLFNENKRSFFSVF